MELVYRQSLECEFHSSDKDQQYSGQLLWDLANYYEHIDRGLLAARATQAGFPCSILRIILA